MKQYVLVLCLLFSGCTRYAPRASHPLVYYNSSVNAEFADGTWLSRYNAAPSVEERNRLIGEFVWTVDRTYDRFEVAFYSGKATEDIAGDFLELGLGGASTLLSSVATKSILALAAVTVTGGKASLDSHLFNMQSREAIVAQMRALRTLQLVQIEQGMQQPLSAYSLTQGIIDVQTYYAAGSIVNALQAISQNASAQAVSATQILRNLHPPVH